MPIDAEHQSAPEPSKGGEFRKQATAAYRIVCAALACFVAAACWAGWYFGGLIGLLIAALASVVIAFGLGFGATFIWAMTQDGA